MRRLLVLLFAALALAVLGVPAAMAEAPDGQRVEWNWGDLVYGRTYRGGLTLANTCATEQRLLIVRDDVPSLVIQRLVLLAPRSSVRVPYTITVQPGTPQKLTDTLRGEVVVWHPGDAGCASVRSVHAVTARVRMPTLQDVEQASAAVDQAAVFAACSVWWMKGQSPVAAIAQGKFLESIRRATARLDERRCASELLASARELRRQSATDDAARNPTAWRWLPSDAAIDRFTMAELIAFRRQVVELRAKEK